MLNRTVLTLADVCVVRNGSELLSGVNWQVEASQRWIVLGQNGAGKTTLMRIASLYLHPTSGEVSVLGEQLGKTDVRTLRARIGICSQALADQLRSDLLARDVVMTARYGALEPWWHTYDESDRERAQRELERVGAGSLADRRLGSLSAGERQRVQLARTLLAAPELLLFDEPAAGLDLGAREDLLVRLGALAADELSPPIVMVTHHTEEIPTGFTHAMLLEKGHVFRAGPIDKVLTDQNLSECFGLSLHVECVAGRWRSWAV